MIIKIFGPPGCGKTTRLLKEMEAALEQGITPNEIGFFSFTNQAANEARTRAMHKFPKYDKPSFKYFRTLHSLAYLIIGGSKDFPCMDYHHWQHFAKVVGYPMTGTANRFWNDSISFDNKTRGDKLRGWCDLARLKGETLVQIWKVAAFDNIGLQDLTHFDKTLTAFKKENGVIDFCDMLEMAGSSNVEVPPFKILFIDEAQDLSSLQWNLVERLVPKAEKTFIAGDDDQAIFTWAGADVKRFTQFPGQIEVLGQSYRLPKKIHSFANKLRSWISDSVPKTWASTSEEGAIKKYNSFDPSLLNLREGQWLLLVRNNYHLQAVANRLKEEGYFFECRGLGLEKGVLSAIYTWERLRRGKTALTSEALNMYEMMRSKSSVLYGSKEALKKCEGEVTFEMLQGQYGLIRTKDDIWHVALDKLPGENIKYIVSCLKNGEKITKEPRIRLTTIHGAKGGEADNVFIFSDMSKRTKETYFKNTNEEFRVWYVGCTRAKKTLHLCHPRTATYFEPLLLNI